MNLVASWAPGWQRLRSGRLGAGWMVVAAFFFALMSVFVKVGGHSFGALELLFYRTLFGALLLGGAMVARQRNPLTPNWRGHLQRSLIGYLSMGLLFYALTHLPLATAITLNYTSSLFFTLICLVRLKEPLTRTGALGLTVGFTGILLLLRPTVSGDMWFAAAMGLASGACAGLAVFQVRELGRMGEAPWRTVFWFFTVASLFGALLLALGPGFTPPTAETFWPLLGIGLTGMCGQLAMTRAYKDGSKFLVASFAYLTVAFSALLGVLLWGDVLPLEALAGILLIVFSGVLAARR